MAYDGYLEFGGNEIVNMARLSTYLRNVAPQIGLGDCEECEPLARALDASYNTPSIDPAPWIDLSDPTTKDFLGLYPLTVQGLDGSTRTAPVTESVVNGGTTGAERLTSRYIRVRGYLVATTREGREAGDVWLQRALDASECSEHGGSCGGGLLCYFSACPQVCDTWQEEFTAGQAWPFTNLDPSQSPLIFRAALLRQSIWRGRYEFTGNLDGVVLNYGAVSVDDTDEFLPFERRGPVMLERTNRVLNAFFRTDLSNWEAAGSAAMERLTVGGPDGLPFMRVQDPDSTQPPFLDASWDGTPDDSTSRIVNPFTGVTTVNRATRPSFELAAAGTTTARVNIIKYGNAEQETAIGWVAAAAGTGVSTTTAFKHHGNRAYSANCNGSVAGQGISMATVAAQAPAPAGSGIHRVSAWVWAPVGAQLQLAAQQWIPDGASFGSEQVTNFVGTGDWQRVSVQLSVTNASAFPRATVRTSLAAAAQEVGFYVDDVVIERNSLLMPEFDGSFAPDGDYTPNWTGTANASSSYLTVKSALGVNADMAQNGWNIQSGLWSDGTAGEKSLRVVSPSMTFVKSASVVIPGIAGKTVTAVVVARLDEASAAPGAFNRTISGTGGVYAQAPNTPGEHELRVTFVAGVDETIYFTGDYGISVWWDSLTVVEVPDLASPYLGPTFDGDTPGSVAIVRTTPIDPITSSETIAAFDLRSPSTNPVLVRMLDDAGTVLRQDSFAPQTDWLRYSSNLSLPATVSRLEFIGDAQYDIARVVVETGHTQLPPFDGDTPWQVASQGYVTGEIDPEYEVAWLGPARASAARMRWLGTAVLGTVMRSMDNPTNNAGVCGGYPRLDVLQGAPSGTLLTDYRLPVPDDEQVAPYERSLHRVSCTEGPRTVTDIDVEGGYLREVEFILNAGKPTPIGATRTVVYPTPFASLPTTEWADPACIDPDDGPIIDPNCALPPAPPLPPSIPESCVDLAPGTRRYWLGIDGASIPAWSSVVPRVTIGSGASEIGQVRVRVYPNPFQRDPDAMVTRMNYATNPKLKNDATGWAMLGSGTATGRQTGTGPLPTIGAWFRATATGTSAVDAFGVRYLVSLDGIAPGEWFEASIFVRMSVLHTGTIRVSWLDGSNIAVGDPIYPFTDGDIFTANTWVQIPVVLRRPVDPNIKAMSFGITGSGGAAWIAGQTIDVTGMLLTKASPTHIYTDNFESAASLANWNLTTGVGTLQITAGAGIGGTSALQITRTPAANSWMNIEYVGGATTEPNARVTSEAYVRTTGGAGTNRSAYISDFAYGQGQPYPVPLAGGPYLQLVSSHRKTAVSAVRTTIHVGNAGSEVYSIFVDSASVYSWFPTGYFDGDTTATGTYYAWAGTPGASASVAMSGLPVDPCSWCAEFVLSYLPPQTELTVDAILERAFASVAGGRARAADNLLYGSDGGVMSWPALTCGIDYLMTFDVPAELADDVTISVDLARQH